jgi:hypothetical protein
MIHLIDRIYIEYAEAKPMPQNPLTKPESYIRIIDRNLAGLHDVDTEDKNLFNCKTIEEAFEKFGTQNEFLNYLISKSNTLENKKIIIFADEVAAIKILCCLWKTIFPKITSEQAFKIYQSYKDFEFFKPKDQMNFIAFDEDSREITKSYFFNKYWGKTLNEFKMLFNPMPSFALSQSQKELIGAEFLMIKYILDPSANHKTLFSKIDHFYKKALMKEIVALKTISSEYIITILKNEPKSYEKILAGHSALDILKSHSKYNLLLDDNIVNSIKGYEHIKDKYNLIKVATDLLASEKIVLSSLDITPEVKDNPCCHYIADNHKEPDLKEHLQDEINYKSHFRIFRELAKKGRYNQYLVQQFAILKNEGEDLSKFSM